MCELSPLPLDGSDCPSFGMASDAEVKPSAEVVVLRLPETGRQAVDQHRDECHVAMMPAEVACRTNAAEADRSVASRTHLSRAAEVPKSGGREWPEPSPRIGLAGRRHRCPADSMGVRPSHASPSRRSHLVGRICCCRHLCHRCGSFGRSGISKSTHGRLQRR